MINAFEEMAIAWRHGILDKRITLESMGNTIVTAYQWTEPLILAKRKASGAEDIWNEFQRLARQVKRIQTSQEKLEKWPLVGRLISKFYVRIVF